MKALELLDNVYRYLIDRTIIRYFALDAMETCSERSLIEEKREEG